MANEEIVDETMFQTEVRLRALIEKAITRTVDEQQKNL